MQNWTSLPDINCGLNSHEDWTLVTSNLRGVEGGDRDLWRAIRLQAAERGLSVEDCFQACRRIRHGIFLSRSIDEFLDTHSANKAINFVGKMAIAKCILDYEKKSPIFINTSNIYNEMEFGCIHDKWYAKAFSLLASGVGVANIAKLFSNIAVISFNYDRSLEFFLLHAIYNHYGCTLEEASNTLATLSIYHPYGLVGELSGHTNQSGAVPFGHTGSPRVDLLQTYTEQIADAKMLAGIKAAVADSERIIFLGFVFMNKI